MRINNTNDQLALHSMWVHFSFSLSQIYLYFVPLDTTRFYSILVHTYGTYPLYSSIFWMMPFPSRGRYNHPLLIHDSFIMMINYRMTYMISICKYEYCLQYTDRVGYVVAIFLCSIAVLPILLLKSMKEVNHSCDDSFLPSFVSSQNTFLLHTVGYLT